MRKVTKIFEIDEYELFDEEINVTVTNGHQEKEIPVPRERFEKWLKYDDRLEWIRDSVDHLGEHVQQTGTVPAEMYWEDFHSYRIKSDLYDFIVLKMADHRTIFDIEKPIKEILNLQIS